MSDLGGFKDETTDLADQAAAGARADRGGPVASALRALRLLLGAPSGRWTFVERLAESEGQTESPIWVCQDLDPETIGHQIPDRLENS